MDLAQANIALHQTPPDISPILRKYVDEAQDRIDGIQRGISVYRKIQADLPVLLGDIAPVTYLVVFTTPASCTPAGGAALSTAVVQFDKGRMEVLEKGPVSPDFTNPASVESGVARTLLRRDERQGWVRGPTCTRTTASPART